MTDHADLIARMEEIANRPDCTYPGHMLDAAMIIKALVRERDEALRHVEQLQDKLDPEHSCACCYDRPDITCGHHSPMLAKAEAERDAALSLLREARGHLADHRQSGPARLVLGRIDALLAEKGQAMRPDMRCPQCGSVLSAVTGECVRGKYCPPHDPTNPFAPRPRPGERIDVMNDAERIAAGLDPNGGFDGPTGAD